MLDDEQMEESLREANLIKDVLGMNVEAFDRYKHEAVKGLIKFGNSFQYHLGQLLNHSEVGNSVKIMNIWFRECSEYGMLYKIWKAKEDAKES